MVFITKIYDKYLKFITKLVFTITTTITLLLLTIACITITIITKVVTKHYDNGHITCIKL